MFGRDPVLPLNTLLQPKVRYMGNDINIISLETMKNSYKSQIGLRKRRSPRTTTSYKTTTRGHGFSSKSQ